jgi:hypothetical protein
MQSISLTLAVFCIATALATANVDIPLGSCANFAVESSAGVTFNGRLTTLHTGSVGVAPGTSIEGSYLLGDGAVERNSPLAISCTADLQTAYKAASSATCPPANIIVELGGRTLLPGVYCSTDKLTISASTVTLDGNNDPNAQWIFQAATSLTTATTTSFILINGAQEKNVYWALGTSAFIGYSSTFAGTILASKAIVFGHDSSIVGRALALTAVSFESGSSVTLPTSTPARYLRSEPETKVASIAITSVSVPLGACATFAVEAGSAMNFNGVKTYINEGSIGISPGTTIQGNYQVIDGSVEVTSTRSNQCQADRVTAYNAANAAPCSANNTRTELSGLTLGPGVYCSGGAMSLSAGTLTLDAFGDSSAVWIFQITSSLVTSPYTSFILKNGAQAKNVYWTVGSSATIGYSSSFVGNILAYASISFGKTSVLNGRGLAGAGVSFDGDSSVTQPAL